MTQRRRTDPDVVRRIRDLAGSGYSGPSIERLMSVDPDYADRLPSLRTIQDIMRESEPVTEWWSVTEASVEEARLVLPVLRERIDHLRKLDAAYRARHGQPPAKAQTVRIARELGAWIAKVRGVAPSLALDKAYKLALRYWMKPGPELDEELARHL